MLIVDDEPMIRMLLEQQLSGYGFETQSAADALAAKRAVAKFDPDVLLVDLDLGEGPNGIDLITMISSTNAALGFVLLTNYSPTALELTSAKRLVYLSKRSVEDIALVVDAINQVLGLDEPATLRKNPENPLSVLTKKQLELLRQLAEGLTNDEIARRANISTRAVEQGVYRIYKALGLNQESGVSRRTTAAKIYAANFGIRRSK